MCAPRKLPLDFLLRTFILCLFLSSLFAAFFLPLAFAQSASSRTLSGTIFDPSASAISGARVTLFSSNGSLLASTSSTESGAFHFDNIAFGKYRLEVEASGFKLARLDLNLSAKSQTPLRIALSIATINETVSVKVEDSAPQVSTEISENQNANNIDRDALDRVPVFDQDYITTLSRFLDDNSIGTSGVSLVVNGIEANGPGVSPSAIQEVKINQNPYSARFARPGRARLEIITKGGTPEFHGTANFLFRDSVFDASNAFAATKAPENRQFYEGSLTGPLGRDKKNTFLLSLENDTDNLQSTVFATIPNGTPIGTPFQANVPSPTTHFFGSFRAFHDFASGDQFWIAYSYEHERQTNQNVGGIVLPSAGTNFRSLEHEINVSYRHIFSPAWVNQLRFLVGHNDEPLTSTTSAPQLIVEGFFTGGGAQADSKRTEAHFDGADLVTYTNKTHLLNFGVDIPDISRRGADDFTNTLGTYTFANLAAFSANQPSTYLVQKGDGHLVFWERIAAGFIEDNLRLKPNLSLSLGLRYYFQSNFHDDVNNFAPRLGFAYAPSAKSKTVFRGGAGVFYDRTGPRAIADLLHYDGITLQRFILTAAPAIPLTYPIDPVALTGLPTSLVTLDPRARIPYTLQYSFGIERQVTAKSSLSATYVGSRGIDLFRSIDANAPFYNPFAPPLITPSRPDPAIGQDRQIQSEGYQKSNSLEITFRGKPAKFFSGQVQYTLSKTYNNTSGITWFPGNSDFPNLDWARSDNDRRHKFDFLGAFQLTDLFSLGVALQAYSGKPVNVITGLDSNGDGITNDRPDAGLAPRNSLHGPGLLNLDLNLEHDFHLSKEKKGAGAGGRTLTVTLNAFNVLNYVNYVTYIGVLGPNLGQPAAALAPRRLQLNLEYKF
jgi:Carboxypeptidase regulatory-like domain